MYMHMFFYICMHIFLCVFFHQAPGVTFTLPKNQPIVFIWKPVSSPLGWRVSVVQGDATMWRKIAKFLAQGGPMGHGAWAKKHSITLTKNLGTVYTTAWEACKGDLCWKKAFLEWIHRKQGKMNSVQNWGGGWIGTWNATNMASKPACVLYTLYTLVHIYNSASNLFATGKIFPVNQYSFYMII